MVKVETGEIPEGLDPERRALWYELQENPDGYESNRDFGLYCAKRRILSPFAEHYLLKALSLSPPMDDLGELMVALGETYIGCEKTELALSVFQTLNKHAPDNPDILRYIGNLQYTMGYMDEASSTLQRVLKIYSEQAKIAARQHGIDKRELFGGQVVMTHLGELAQKIDLYLKSRALGLSESFEPVLFVKDEDLCNRCLLDYWGEYLTLQPLDDSNREDLEKRFEFSMHILDIETVPDGRALLRESAYPLVQREWERQNRPPLLQLTDDHKKRGRRWLKERGVPETAWFVCMHVREPHTYQEDVPWSSNKYRNAEIETYYDAIRAITDRGGWVIRVGDKSMTPLEGFANVIDYATGEDHEDWIDIFIMGAARFFLGGASGPCNVAITFGVPLLGINWFPLGQWLNTERDVFIHKRFRNTETGRLLNIRESITPPLFLALSPFSIDDAGLDVIPNTPDEIREAAIEMMDRLDGVCDYSDADNEVQGKYMAMADPYNIQWSCRVGRYFLNQHPELIVDQEKEQ